MVMLQHKLSVKLSQRQILTPGLVQMVSVLALNKLELKDMINTEMVENRNRIDPGKRFVEQYESRIDAQAAGDLHATALAAR